MNIPKPMKIIASVTILCTLLALSTIANANHSVAFDSPRHHQKYGAHRGNIMKQMVKVLSLSEQQQAQIKAIKKQAKAKTRHAIFNVLTTEQQQKWLEKMAKRKEKSTRG